MNINQTVNALNENCHNKQAAGFDQWRYDDIFPRVKKSVCLITSTKPTSSKYIWISDGKMCDSCKEIIDQYNNSIFIKEKEIKTLVSDINKIMTIAQYNKTISSSYHPEEYVVNLASDTRKLMSDVQLIKLKLGII